MRIKVELRPEVRRFLRTVTPNVRGTFFEKLHWVCEDPIVRSFAYHDPTVSKYMVRYFRFSNHVALFGYLAARDEIKVIECRFRDPVNDPHQAT